MSHAEAHRRANRSFDPNWSAQFPSQIVSNIFLLLFAEFCRFSSRLISVRRLSRWCGLAHHPIVHFNGIMREWFMSLVFYLCEWIGRAEQLFSVWTQFSHLFRFLWIGESDISDSTKVVSSKSRRTNRIHAIKQFAKCNSNNFHSILFVSCSLNWNYLSVRAASECEYDTMRTHKWSAYGF